jgi:hypothetical protein
VELRLKAELSEVVELLQAQPAADPGIPRA